MDQNVNRTTKEEVTKKSTHKPPSIDPVETLQETILERNIVFENESSGLMDILN